MQQKSITIFWACHISTHSPLFSHPTHLCRCSPHRWWTVRCESWGRQSGRRRSPRRTESWRSWRRRERGCNWSAWWANTAVWAPSAYPRTSRRTWGPWCSGGETKMSGQRRGKGSASAARMPSREGLNEGLGWWRRNREWDTILRRVWLDLNSKLKKKNLAM